jgi:hypothetical protein
MTGFVYFIAAELLGVVKIGFSASHPDGRLKELQTGCPARLKLLAFVEGSLSEERQLHRRFSGLCTHGEWFRFEGEVRFLINALSGCKGSSPRVLFDRALERIAAREEDYELDYLEMPLGNPFRGPK